MFLRVYIKRKYWFFLIVMLFTYAAQSQMKYEREYRLKESLVPEPALDFVYTLPLDSKVKWYFEENLEGNSIEGKFKYKQEKISVEFDTLGVFQDLEIETSIKNIPETLRIEMHRRLGSMYKKYAIKKIQVQYSGGFNALKDLLEQTNDVDKVIIKYECIVKIRADKEWHLYEMLFDDQGRLEKRSEIIFRNTDNLEY